MHRKESMNSIIALCQITASTHLEDNLKKAEQCMKKAKKQGAHMIVFPEYFMTYYPSKDYVSNAQSLSGNFVMELREHAKKYGLWVIAGCNEKSPGNNKKCYNTSVVISDTGELAGYYRKQHLFDAFSYKESEQTLKGTENFTPIKTPIGTIGLGICYDLRFPELARYEALHGCDVMFYPSAWVKGEGKFEQWQVLLRARAIENGMYVIGCCHYDKEHYMGKSIVADPLGNVIAAGGEREEIIFCEINHEKSMDARKLIPNLCFYTNLC